MPKVKVEKIIKAEKDKVFSTMKTQVYLMRLEPFMGNKVDVV
ncbi:MAG: hypothetical protein QQN62_07710 [Nitrosopumilus sp.]